MKNAWIVVSVAGAVVLGIYAYTARLGALESMTLPAADDYYNLLVQGFQAGQLSLKKEVPPKFARLADPYDPVANGPYRSLPYRLSDLSYYKGRFYLYFGITPALILYWPCVALTGHYLSDRQAVTIFCAIGVLAGLGLLRALSRRYFAEVNVFVVAACALGLAVASGVPVLLPQSDVYEVAIICGYMLTMLALVAVWCAVHEPERRGWWLAAASVAYGLAVGARPSLLFGAVILLVPVMQAWREQQRTGRVLLAATGPILLIGLGLMLYNVRRFDNPFEFGVRYQLGGQRQLTWQFFSLRYLWFNFRVYFLEPVRWRLPFPFVHGIIVPRVPTGHNGVVEAFGILTNTPLSWLALAAPLAWRGRPEQRTSGLCWFVMGVAAMFGMCALTLSLVCGANLRYEVDFLPSLLMLSVIGILGLERVLTNQPGWRRAACWGWGLLLGYSVVFNILMSLENYGYAGCAVGGVLAQDGHLPEAIQTFEEALRIKPDYAEGHNNLGKTLLQAGKVPVAIGHFEEALQLRPGYADAHDNLGKALTLEGRLREAQEQFEQAVRLNPDDAEAQNNLAVVLGRTGRIPEAIAHCERALQLQPEYAEAQSNLGNIFYRTGRLPEAIDHYEQALRIKPNYAEVHCNLAAALGQAGRMPEALGHLEQALRIKPDFAEARYNMGNVLVQLGRIQEAIEQYQQVLRIRPDFAEARTTLERLQATNSNSNLH